MAKKKSAKKQKQNILTTLRRHPRRTLVVLLFALSAGVNGAFYVSLRNNLLVDKTNAAGQASFSIQPNQACAWQDFDKLTSSFKLKLKQAMPHSLYGGIYEELAGLPVGQHICTMATSVDTEGGSGIVKVMYFLNYEDAKRYSQKDLESTKYWSPGGDEDLWHIFSYVNISDGGRGKPESGEAFSVKDDMVIYFSLPCTKLDPGACEVAIRAYMDTMLKNVDETYGGQNQNPFRSIKDIRY